MKVLVGAIAIVLVVGAVCAGVYWLLALLVHAAFPTIGVFQAFVVIVLVCALISLIGQNAARHRD